MVEVCLRLRGQQLHLRQVNIEAAEAVREVEGGAARDLRLQVEVMTQLEHLVGRPALPTLAVRELTSDSAPKFILNSLTSHMIVNKY